MGEQKARTSIPATAALLWQRRSNHVAAPARRRGRIMLMRHVHPKLQFTHMLPYGAILHENGVQFVVFSRSATAMRLLLYETVWTSTRKK